MVPRLQELCDDLDRRLTELLGTLREMDEAQRSYSPRPGAWSPLQVAQHLLIAERGTGGTMAKNLGRPSARRGLGARLGYLAVWIVMRFDLRVRNPARSTEPGAERPLDEIERDWSEVRSELREALEAAPESALRQAGFKHPVSGPLTLEESLVFLVRHLDHHLVQVERIRRAPGYPAS